MRVPDLAPVFEHDPDRPIADDEADGFSLNAWDDEDSEYVYVLGGDNDLSLYAQDVGKRGLRSRGDGTADMPIPYTPGTLGKLREDQVPRFYAALTDRDTLPTRRVRIDGLRAMQDRVDERKVEAMRGRDMTGNHPVVVELDDGLHVADGHHRIVAAWLDGAEDIEARYKDLRAVSSALKAMSIDAAIVKVDDEQRTVWGWASVIAEDGKPVVDRQGDIITEADLIAAAHDFMLNARQAKAMHEGDRVGDVVESMVLTEDRAKALGIPGGGKVGWLIAMKIHDDAVWKRVKAGELRAFSIGGRGKRREV